jgi:regulatory protein
MPNIIKHYALNLLARREHSQVELRAKLIAKGYDANDISTVLQGLVNEKAQSDERFAESYMHMRANRGYGPLRIRAELRERGINNEIIDKIITFDDQLWTDNAQKIWHKKFGGKIPTSFQERTKQMKFLQYKGFDIEQIKLILKGNYEND